LSLRIRLGYRVFLTEGRKATQRQWIATMRILTTQCWPFEGLLLVLDFYLLFVGKLTTDYTASTLKIVNFTDLTYIPIIRTITTRIGTFRSVVVKALCYKPESRGFETLCSE
jgi:hypothetical protein